jgi:outer membrane biosynthesis protein TonB
VRHERQTGLAFSVALHLLLLLLLIFGLPSILKNPPPIEPAAITVELLPITGVTNVKPLEGTVLDKPKPEEPKPEPEQKKPAPPVKAEKAAPPPPPKSEPKPTPKEAEKIPDPTKVEKKPEEKKPEPKKDEEKEKPKKAKEDDLDAILKAVKDTAQKEKTDKKPDDKKESAPTQKVTSNKYDSSIPMSLSEKDAIMSQISKCWSPPAGAKDAKNLAVVIKAEFNVDGSLIKAEIADESKGRYNSDPFFRTAAEAALRAVRHPDCTPLKNLPQDKYGTWKSMELNFDPQFFL